MTGMGSDGVAGCQSIQQAGGFVLGQDQASSDVYGMNKAAFVAGAVNEQFSLDDLPKLIPTHCRRLFLTH
jgi:two-component system chemotaxis response regulator CheB